MPRAFFVALSAVIIAFSAPITSQAVSGVYQKAVLDNGMTVVTQAGEGEVAAACIFVRVGAADEDPGSSGITSLVNSIILSCHPMAGKNAPAFVIEQYGGKVGVQTSSDFTCFTLVAPVDSFGDALKALAGAIEKPNCTVAALATEKEALAARAGGGFGRIEDLAYGMFIEETYKGLPYGLDPAGDPEAIAGLTSADVDAWHAARYRPENMLVSVCGRLTAAEALQSVAEAFHTAAGDGDAVRPPVKDGVGAAVQETARFQVTGPKGQAAAVLGYTAPAADSPDYPAMKIAEALLAGGTGSMMFRALRDEKGLAYRFGSRLSPRMDVSRLAFFVVTDDDKLDQAVDGMRRVVDALVKGEFTGAELERARKFAIGELAFAYETSDGRAFNDGLYELLGLSAGFGRRLDGLLEGMKKADVTGAAGRYLDKYTLVILKPQGP